MALVKMRMCISCGHLDSHSTNTDLILNNQEFSTLMFKLCNKAGTYRGGHTYVT